MERESRERVRRENFSNFQNSNNDFASSKVDEGWFEVIRDDRYGKRRIVPEAIKSRSFTRIHSCAEITKGWGEKSQEKRDSQNSNWNPDFQWVRKINWEDPIEREELLRWIGSYGFLLEDDMLKALGKKNMKLLSPAVARINYLSTKINRSSLLAAMRGEEEAIIDVQTFLLNEGWWDRAQKLRLKDFGLEAGESESRLEEAENLTKDFIQTYKELVHPSVLQMVARKDPEGIGLALNHIHSGSLNKSRRAKAQKMAAYKFLNEIKQDAPNTELVETQRREGDYKESLIKFIFSHSDKVKMSTMKGVTYNNDSAISDALNQIHLNSLKNAVEKEGKNLPNYLEAVKSKSDIPVNKANPSSKMGPSPSLPWDSLFFTGFDGVSLIDIWKGVKQVARIKDIVIPARLDKNNKKFGFIKPFSAVDAHKLIKASNQLVLGGQRVRIERAKPRRVTNINKATPPRVIQETRTRGREEDTEDKPSEQEKVQVVVEDGMEEWDAMLARSARIDLGIDYAPDSLWELILSKGFGDLGVEISEVRNVVFWKDEAPINNIKVDSSSSSEDRQGQTMEGSLFPSPHPEVVSVGSHSNNIEALSIGLSEKCLQVSSESEDSVNYLEPVTEELRGDPVNLWGILSIPGTGIVGGGDESSSNTDNTSFTHDVLNADDGSCISPLRSTKSHSDLCSVIQNLRIKRKGGRMRKGGRISCFDKQKRPRKRKETVPDWMVGRYVRVWKSTRPKKSRGKVQGVKRKVATVPEQETQGVMGKITAEDVYRLGVNLGLNPTKDMPQMINSIEGRL
ncbi:hypothetical protein ACET3Z_023969 [Daucus carota]